LNTTCVVSCAGFRADFVQIPHAYAAASKALVGPKQRDGLVVRQRLGGEALAADDALGAPQPTVIRETTQ
jgi:hypothetical protein